MRNRKFYIAGPFFNPPQIELIKSIELLMVEHEMPFYSPRLTDDNRQPGPITVGMADRIFQRNVENISDCTDILAVLDWKMPPDTKTAVVRTGPKPELLELVTSLNIPDSGTVFEMGVAWGMTSAAQAWGAPGHSFKKWPIYGFTERRPEEAINVMLTRACVGVIHGVEGLAGFLAPGKRGGLREVDAEYAQPWAGRNS